MPILTCISMGYLGILSCSTVLTVHLSPQCTASCMAVPVLTFRTGPVSLHKKFALPLAFHLQKLLGQANQRVSSSPCLSF